MSLTQADKDELKQAITAAVVPAVTNAVLAAIEPRFQQIDERFDVIDERFKAVDRRFGQIDERFNNMDKKIDQLSYKQDTTLEAIQSIHQKMGTFAKQHGTETIKTDVHTIRLAVTDTNRPATGLGRTQGRRFGGQ